MRPTDATLGAPHAETRAETAPPASPGTADSRRGALFLVAASAVFPLTGLAVRRLRGSLPAIEVAFLWCAASALVFLATAWVTGLRLRPRHPRVFVLRGVTGALVTILFFSAVQRIPLGTATLLLYSEPVWVALIASMRGVERPRGYELLFVATAVAGVALIADPFFGDPGLGEGLALLAGIAAAGSVIGVREMRRLGESIPTTYFAFLSCSAVLYAPFALAFWRTPRGEDLPWLALFLAAGTAGNFLMTHAFRFLRATTGTVLAATEAAFAMGWAWIAFGEVPALAGWIGAVVLLGSVVALTAPRRAANAAIASPARGSPSREA